MNKNKGYIKFFSRILVVPFNQLSKDEELTRYVESPKN